MMVSNIQNHWVSGLCPPSGILNTINHNVSETGCFHLQKRGGRQSVVSITGPVTGVTSF
jgi:hypothetical protein